ncbi:ATP-binding protein [Akkermansiaceae bacterium]|nr:ATP-binding protein [Akkermansiaceae bacterium]MDB4537792.1 ATP-binding protein [Akkermansiaceae bacterium]
MKIPLSLRIFLLLLFNVSVAALMLSWVAGKYYSVGWDQLTRSGAEPRLVSMAELVNAGLDETDPEFWGEVLKSFEKAYHVDLGLYRPFRDSFIDGTQWELSDEENDIFTNDGPPPGREEGQAPRRRGPRGPEELDNDRRPPRRPGAGPLLGRGPDGMRDDELRRPPRAGNDGIDLRFLKLIHTEKGEVGVVRIDILDLRIDQRQSAILFIREKDGCELFFSWQPLFWGLVCVLLFSCLVWLPWVYRITRRLGILTRGAESISHGDFDVSLATKRSDEIGRLSRSLQSMAGRLDDYVSGQKRFLGDIAHELCSPLVRIRMGLGVLEHKLEREDYQKLESVNDEVAELSQLVNELLDFSKASLKPKSLKMEAIDMGELCAEIIRREKGEGLIPFSVPLGLKIETNRDLFKRAIGNVVRNALKYAGEVKVNVTLRKGAVDITIEDRGPGLPEKWIEKIFEPFARPDGARTRESGGTGLGMAISKTCIESLGGTVTCANREGGGLRVVFTLPR